ncbi:unnamed protein product [Symbiodinium natans]|uniref:Aminopeptidase n=1 Tax=Symbiodinium natans TaxID=878477 RepID=A0A812JHZ3_9DINO|nr:unnamed protein product [Symbiodinium natans]
MVRRRSIRSIRSRFGSVCWLLLLLCGRRALLAFLQSENHPEEGSGDAGSDLALTSERAVLPAEVLPDRYDLDLDLDPEHLDTFSGSVAIGLEVTSATPFITLNARALSIDFKSVAFQPESAEAVLNPIDTTEDAELERVIFHFSENLPLGRATLRISYAGQLGQDMAGLYSSRYKSLHGWKSMALTQFEAVDARRMFPCWDEPSKKAVFGLSVSIPAALVAVSNMPSASETTISRNKKRVTFLDTPRMSSYLLALAVGRFDSIQAQTESGTLIRVLTVPGQAILGEFALDIARKSLVYYETYFEAPYPLPKLDMLAAPDFAAGAMENWGLVIYREVDLLCNVSTISVARKVRIATVVTHELSHMWFGNLVTMEWWEQLWLNEGFANWMQTHAVNTLFPEWHIWEQYVVQEQSRALSLDALRSSHPIEVPIRNAKEVDEVFDAISYCKGGSIVRMLTGVLGQDHFREGLRLYMKRFEYKNTASSDLWTCWEEVSGIQLREMMNSWTRQQGFPVLTVNESLDSGVRGTRRLTVKQQWFLADGSALPGDSDKLWQIPLLPGPLKEAANGKQPLALLDKKSDSWQVPANAATWIKFNFGQLAPYRVLYASQNLRSQLSKAVRSGEASAVDRIGLLMDAMAFAKQGQQPIRELLRLLAAFKGEKSAHVWEALNTVLRTLHRTVLAIQSTEYTLALQEAVGNGLLRGALREASTFSAHESDLVRQKRALVMALVARYMPHDREVREEAQKKFDAWLEAPTLSLKQELLPDDLKTSIFRIVLSNANGNTQYQALRRYVKGSDTPQAVRLSIYKALGAASRKDLRMKTLDMAMGGRNGVRLQDIMYPIQGVAAMDPDGAQIAWRWFLQRRRAITSRLRGANVRLLGSVIDCAAGALPDKSHANAVEALFEQHPVPGLERSIAQLVEAIRTEAKFVARMEDEMGQPEMKEVLEAFQVQAIGAVLATAASTVAATQLTHAAQSRYTHISMMALLLPLAHLLARGERYIASLRDVCVFLPLWVLSNYSLTQALALAPAGVVQTLFGTGPSQVAVLSRIFLAERFTFTRTVAVLLAFAGATILASRSGFQRQSGENVGFGSCFALAAVFASASYKVSFKVRLGTPPPHVVLGTVGTLGAVTAVLGLPLVLLLAELGAEDRWWSRSAAVNWPLVIGSAAVDVVYNTSIAWGLAFASPVFISVGVVVGTPVNMFIDATLHGEMPSLAQYVGAAVIAVSFALLVCVPTSRSEMTVHSTSSDSLVLSAREGGST